MIPKKADRARSCSFQRSKILFLQTCAVMVLVCIVCYTCIQSGERHSTPQEFLTDPIEVILLWTMYFKERDWLPSTRDLKCPLQCDVTSNRSLLANSSAVILHWRNLDPDDLPETCERETHRCPALVLFNKEAPPHTPWKSISEIHSKIHWTATYRRDSELYTPYGEIVRRTDTYKMPGLDSKRTLVCWLVSHCNTPSNREVYVNSLKRYVDVEVYGKCGNKSCPHTKSLDCYQWLAERCKFYLSLENSICKDYVTEKLYYAMMTDMVPVVLGGDDYARHLPAHSFIDVADYSSPEALATYLKELGKDEARYLAYFNWKKDRVARVVEFEWLCELCKRLHSRTGRNDLKPHKGFRDWWFDAANCGSLSWSKRKINVSTTRQNKTS